jgi:hypothetical protein
MASPSRPHDVKERVTLSPCWVMRSAISTGVFPSAVDHDDCLLGDVFGYYHWDISFGS